MSENRPPGAQLSNAWKQRRYPALWSAMLGACHAFYSDNQKLTSREAGFVSTRDIAATMATSQGKRFACPVHGPGRRVRPPYNFVGSNSAALGDRRLFLS